MEYPFNNKNANQYDNTTKRHERETALEMQEF
jgi:hypothetical protein